MINRDTKDAYRIALWNAEAEFCKLHGPYYDHRAFKKWLHEEYGIVVEWKINEVDNEDFWLAELVSYQDEEQLVMFKLAFG